MVISLLLLFSIWAIGTAVLCRKKYKITAKKWAKYDHKQVII